MTEQLKTSSKRTQQGASRQGEFKNRRKSRSRPGNEADRRRAEAALFRLRLWLRRDRVVAKRRRRRVAKAEVFFAPKSTSLRRRLPFLNTHCFIRRGSDFRFDPLEDWRNDRRHETSGEENTSRFVPGRHGRVEFRSRRSQPGR